ncbi:MAG: GNAT family N-acetyltransferase [Burkholderiales bacterium]
MPPLTLLPILPNGRIDGRNRPLTAIAEIAARDTASMRDYAGRARPWIGYAAFDGDTCVGTCAFKHPPRDGEVEIAYFAFPDAEGRGVATSMARELVAIARQAEPALAITARTLPAPGASTRILEKLRFQRTGTIDDPEDGPVWEWRLAPATAGK